MKTTKPEKKTFFFPRSKISKGHASYHRARLDHGVGTLSRLSAFSPEGFAEPFSGELWMVSTDKPRAIFLKWSSNVRCFISE